ncbi:MAG TPA: hypothetical protein DEA08_32260 [Planctomycetes bacterium]|nr:hypothetical protein [Planctomycetota bacterium]
MRCSARGLSARLWPDRGETRSDVGTAKILVIDDEQSLLEVLEIVLGRSGYEVRTAATEEAGYAAFREFKPDLVLLDLRIGGVGGLELLNQLKETDPLVPVIVITAYSTWDNAVEAMRRGAYDFIKKPFDDNDLVREVVARALAQRTMLSKGELRDAASEILGNSEPMRYVLDVVKRVAPTDSTVLVTGESGTGKELLARAMHYCSHRAGGPFLSVNCAAFPETLLESELFGHVRGAFSGAHADKKGLIEVCNEGTFFMDEVGDLSPGTQVKLLRVLEERRLLPVGGTKPRKIDVRFVCATNRDLEEAVRDGSFRADLYYRINVLPIHLPPLRDRRQDIPLLAAHFMNKYARKLKRELKGITPEVQQRLMNYAWPGNVRELENTIQRAVTLARRDVLDTDPILAGRRAPAESAPDESVISIPDEGLDLEKRLEEIERRYLLAAIDKTEGHLTNAAKLLGISFRAIRYKVKKYGLRESGVGEL